MLKIYEPESVSNRSPEVNNKLKVLKKKSTGLRGFGVILELIALFTRAEYSISIGLLDSYIVYKGGSVCSQKQH